MNQSYESLVLAYIYVYLLHKLSSLPMGINVADGMPPLSHAAARSKASARAPRCYWAWGQGEARERHQGCSWHCSLSCLEDPRHKVAAAAKERDVAATHATTCKVPSSMHQRPMQLLPSIHIQTTLWTGLCPFTWHPQCHAAPWSCPHHQPA